MASLSGSFILRSFLSFVARKFISFTGSIGAGNVPGLGPGAYEFHIVKTGHLGLCQVITIKVLVINVEMLSHLC